MPESARFPVTAWTDCVRVAQNEEHPDFVSAVNHLITAYWRPIFHYLRTKGHKPQDAEDLTQEFFVRFLTKSLKKADPRKGRSRSFLKTLVARFAIDHTVRSAQWKLESRFVSVHSLVKEEDRVYEPEADDAEAAFERQWKAEVLATVQRNLQASYDGNATDRKRYEIFAAYHLADRKEDRLTQEELAERFGVSRDAVRAALAEVQKRYERMIRQEVREQVGSEDEVEIELREFLS